MFINRRISCVSIITPLYACREWIIINWPIHLIYFSPKCEIIKNKCGIKMKQRKQEKLLQMIKYLYGFNVHIQSKLL